MKTSDLIRQIVSKTEGNISNEFLTDLSSFSKTQLELILNYAKSNQLYCD
jgi:hypothetical protein